LAVAAIGAGIFEIPDKIASARATGQAGRPQIEICIIFITFVSMISPENIQDC